MTSNIQRLNVPPHFLLVAYYLPHNPLTWIADPATIAILREDGAVDKCSSGVRVWVVEEVADVRGSGDDVDCGGCPDRV